MNLKTQPNEARCAETIVTHVLDLPQCCPMSGNPQHGSTIAITYTPLEFLIEVESLHGYVNSYRGGRGAVRTMEGMIQAIAQDCANCVQVEADVKANLNLAPEQKMIVQCFALPAPSPQSPWISLEDRLPSSGDYYLVCYDGTSVEQAMFLAIGSGVWRLARTDGQDRTYLLVLLLLCDCRKRVRSYP